MGLFSSGDTHSANSLDIYFGNAYSGNICLEKITPENERYSKRVKKKKKKAFQLCILLNHLKLVQNIGTLEKENTICN